MHKLYNKMVEEIFSGRMVITDDLLCFEGIGPSMAKTYAHLTVNRKDFDSKAAVVEGLKLVAGESSIYGNTICERMVEIVDILREDKYSREAVLLMNSHINTVQFSIRNDTLETNVHVHSWDIVEDFPRDMLAFGILAQVVARCLNVQIGYVYYAVNYSYVYPGDMHQAQAESDLQVCLGPAWPCPGNEWYAFSLRAEHAVKEFKTYDVISPGVMRVTEV